TTTVNAGTLLLDDNGGVAIPSANVVIGDFLGGSGVNKADVLRLLLPVQLLTFGNGITGGTFTLTFNGQTTGAITWSSTGSTLAANIQAALALLTNVGNGNVSVTGNGPFTVTF